MPNFRILRPNFIEVKFDLLLVINLTKDILVKYFMVFNRYFKLQFNVIVLQHVSINYGLKTVTRISPCHFGYILPKFCDLLFLFRPAHAHFIWTRACASQLDLCMRISLGPAHVHHSWACTCASQLGLRMRISLGPARAHLTWTCACASHLDLRVRIPFGPAQVYVSWTCACASQSDLRKRTSFWPTHAHFN